MNEQPPVGAPPPTEDIQSGKTMAILCYIPFCLINLIVSIICLTKADNAFSLYHAKQSVTLLLACIAACVVYVPLAIIAAMVPLLSLLVLPLMLVIGLGSFVLLIMGIINAAGGHYKPLPLIGKIGENLFKGIQKKS